MIINSQNKKIFQTCLFVLVAIVVLGIGYASISAINMIINNNATVSVNQNNYKVYFTSTADTPSLTGNVTVTGSAEISSQDNTFATFNVEGLTKVGDYAIATYTVINDSEEIGAEILLNLSNSNKEYFRATATDTQLQAGDTTLATIKVEMLKTPIDGEVTTSVVAKLKASPIDNADAVGGASNSLIRPTPFERDSWATIKTNVQNGYTSQYNVGDTKEITINNTNYTVRIANKTTGEHCGDNDTAYSQTACGFVVEFVDVLSFMGMIGYDWASATTNGGYPNSNPYRYLNENIDPSLPDDLKDAIIETRVISGYYTSYADSNYLTNDFLYLLSATEVNRDVGSTESGTSRVLDYYNNNSGDLRIKKYNGSESNWWLRTVGSKIAFYLIQSNGSVAGNESYLGYGVSPAFRIG